MNNLQFIKNNKLWICCKLLLDLKSAINRIVNCSSLVLANTIDLKGYYNQLLLRKEDKEKIMFTWKHCRF
jgi:hypothetical protein